MPDASSTIVFLIRHAAHDRLERVLCGRMPGVRLGEAGRAQASALGSRLARETIAAVYASPLERCRETADRIAGRCGVPVRIAEPLNEIDFGDWTGLAFDDLARDERWRAWNRERAVSAPPGGEPMTAVQDRAASAIDGWRDAYPGGAIVAVSHCDVVKAICCRWLGLSLDRYHAFEIGPASITTLVVWAGGGKILALNEAVAS